jgi:hypothetical protein
MDIIPRSATGIKSSSSRNVALIFLCNPKCAPLPAAVRELADVRGALERNAWRVETLVGGDATRLCHALTHHQPRLLHFIGHADARHRRTKQRTLGLTNANGDLVLSLPKTLADLIAAHDVDLCFLNGCRSASLARDLSLRGVCTIGWETDAHDLAAAIFAQAVYNNLSPPAAGSGPLDVTEVRKAFQCGLSGVVDNIGRARGGVSGTSQNAQVLKDGSVRLQFELAPPALSVLQREQGCEHERRIALAGVPLLLLPPQSSPPCERMRGGDSITKAGAVHLSIVPNELSGFRRMLVRVAAYSAAFADLVMYGRVPA